MFQRTKRDRITSDKEWAITTLSGDAIDIFAPIGDIIKVINLRDIARALSNQCRYNGQVVRYYSVAQHSVLVSRILGKADYGIEVRLAGLLHDSAEAYLGDIVGPLKKRIVGLHGPDGVTVPFDDIEEKLLSAILFVVGGKSLCETYNEHMNAIKHADLIALSTENRDLRPPCAVTSRKLPEPIKKAIYARHSGEAFSQFVAELAGFGVSLPPEDS